MRVCLSQSVLFLLVLLLPGCSKIIEWGKESFYQGDDVAFSRDLIERYIRSVSVYDQGTTLAKFDVLWLGDEIRTEYARFHTYIAGRNEEQYQALLRRQLEENKHFIAFYVLSIYENPLGDLDSKWHVTLRINNKEFSPTEIKVVELAPEYQTFLGSHFNRFRVPYRVMFDAKDLEEMFLLREETDKIQLFFRSTQKQVFLEWYVDRENRVVEPITDPQQLIQKKRRVKPERTELVKEVSS